MNRWLSGILTALVLVFTAGTIVTWATGSLTVPNTIFTQPNPVPTSLLDQNYTAIANYVNAREITFGVLASRPTAGTAGRYYFATDTLTFYADTGTAWTQLSPAVNAVNAQALTGLTLANNGTSTNSITIAQGAATSDDATIANRVLMTLTASLTKRPGAAWAVGSGTGCLDTGAAATFTWYHVFLIERVDTGVVDALCSTSATAPTMPTNYTKKRRIGAVRSTWFPTAGAEYYFFAQTGNYFRWATTTSTLDVSTAASGVVAVTATLSTPNGVQTLAHLNVMCGNTSACYISELTATDEATGFSGTAPLGSVGTAGGGLSHGQIQVMTDTASSIRRRSSVNADIGIVTLGYWDRRGQE